MGSHTPAADQQQLHLVIIGGGIAGLSAAIATTLAGHRCTVLEKAPDFAEVGAGLQLTPNGTRLLAAWGVLDHIAPAAIADPQTLTVRRFDGARVLACEAQWAADMQQRYGAPFWDVHRADLQAAMLARARELGVCIRSGAEVTGIDFARAVVTVIATATVAGGGAPGAREDEAREEEEEEKEEQVCGDVVLAADGLWSRARALFLLQESSDHPVTPLPTGDIAYRIVLKREDLAGDTELEELVGRPQVNFWVGAGAHVVGYSLRAGNEFNLVLLCPDDLPPGCSRAPANMDEMKARFRGWDPILTRFLDRVKAVEKWRLMHFSSLKRWNDGGGRFTMAGDACHPMLPYLAQGANSAIEDGGVLGRLLGSAKTRADVPLVLELYQALRKARVEEIAKQALKQRFFFHLPDGPWQVDRDRVLTGEQSLRGESPSRWSCPIVQPWLYGYDAIAEADEAVRGTRLA
ncbi:FAD binding domain-containing protein [Chaetomium strumarium]|uniref:FAD binding domain-containing protein n=1 Tax=Chaetomium strumarium TaxID=1170767 RepID=A0AAJ0M2Z1_9PEZI|nr:FAD binding domain-containing protein [Chaetomium strumarium]